MRDQGKLITLVGGSGFLGRYAVKLLADKGYRIQVLCRDTEAAAVVKPAGDVGQIAIRYADLAKSETLDGALDGSYAVVNLVGKLFEKGNQKFAAIHAKGSEVLAQKAADAGVEKFVQVSALGVDRAHNAKYAKTKLLGEKAVYKAFPSATILRPSIVFGPEDGFFNMFAQMGSLAPALPAIGGGKSKFQPVYVNDVARAIAFAIAEDVTAGKTYELGGPDVYTFEQLLRYTLETSGQSACIVPVPSAFAKVGATFAEFLPKPPLTRDQVTLLKYDNIVSNDALTLEAMGIQATPIQQVVPDYLSRFRAA